MPNTPWTGSISSSDKLYLQSGQFEGTLKTSRNMTLVDTIPIGISWDGENTPWSGEQGKKPYLQSGQFSATMKTSGAFADGGDISFDGTNTPYAEEIPGASKLLLISGQFEATIKDSVFSPTTRFGYSGISFDAEGNTPWCTFSGDKLLLNSGQILVTVKNSLFIGTVDNNPSGMEWDENGNIPWCGQAADKLYLQSAQFGSTLKTSESVQAVNSSLNGISYSGPFWGGGASAFWSNRIGSLFLL